MLRTLGWLVAHSLWQGAVVAGVFAAALGLMRRRSANARYLAGVAALTVTLVLPVVTVFAGVGTGPSEGRRHALAVADQVIGVPALFWWGSVIVPIAGGLWLAGLGVTLARTGAEARRVLWLTGGGHHPAGGLPPDLEGTRRVIVRTSDRAAVPMVIGWRRPIVLLPAGSRERLEPSQLRAILLHELGHVRRRDYLVNLCQSTADALLFHHPAARWISGRVRTEREYCCDDLVIAAGADPVHYARALATLEDARAGTGLVVAAGSGTLLDRIERLLDRPRRGLTPARGLLVLAVLVLLALPVATVTLAVPANLPWAAEVRRRTAAPAAGGASAVGAVPPGAERLSESRPRGPAPGAAAPPAGQSHAVQ
jgi:hypothetical protein